MSRRPRRAAVAALCVAVASVLLIGGAGLALTGQRVVGSSMAPALADGELLVANPFDREPARFDLVVLAPRSGSPELVKRVVGLPGDDIEIDAATVRLRPAGTRDWLRVVRPDGAAPWRAPTGCCDPDGRAGGVPTVVTVPPGRYFVLGDNPDSSTDSRRFGFVEAATVRARVAGRMWPPGPLSGPDHRLVSDP